MFQAPLNEVGHVAWRSLPPKHCLHYPLIVHLSLLSLIFLFPLLCFLSAPPWCMAGNMRCVLRYYVSEWISAYIVNCQGDPVCFQGVCALDQSRDCNNLICLVHSLNLSCVA